MQGARKRCPRWRLGLVIALVIAGLLMPAPPPALALNSNLAIGCTILGLLATPVIAYGVYENLPSRRDQPRYMNGEFYAGGFMGVAFTPNQNLRYPGGVTVNGVSNPGSFTLYNNQFATSLTGGGKFGYFTHSIHYLGLEVESGVNNSYVNRRSLALSPAIQGATRASVPNDFMVNWTTALHIVGRYGFLPDQEVTFGRLQPYVGIGPSFVVLYDEVDSAKNFGIDLMAGVRYMFNRNISAFVEYKFNYQWNVELESHPFYLPSGNVCRGDTEFDLATHRVVMGVGYHW